MFASPCAGDQAARGFTLLETIIVLAVIGLLFAVSSPALDGMLKTMEYREAVRYLAGAARQAKREAQLTGTAIDLIIDAKRGRFIVKLSSDPRVVDEMTALPDSLTYSVISAAGVTSSDDLAGIRFYPAGGSTGGEITVTRPSGTGTLIVVDWLLGSTEQRPL